MSKLPLPAVLSIAGSDSGAGAGIQADLLTFAGNGTYGTTALTCLTAQNPDSIIGIQAMEPEFVVDQAEQVLRFYPVKAIKTGMLFSEAIIHAVCELLATHADIPAVIDPVMVASSGDLLLQEGAVLAVQEQLLPQATVITPNLDEAAVILGRKLNTIADIEDAARELSTTYGTNALVKGGHLKTDELVDILCTPGGNIYRYTSTRIHNMDTHGTGCTLSSAIAAQLAKGKSLPDAVSTAHAYLQAAFKQGLLLKDTRYINHSPKLSKR